MGKCIDLTGMRFGSLIAIERVGSDKHKKAIWMCQCDCGENVTVPTGTLKSGNTTSCGCKKIETTRRRLTVHGMTKPRVHQIWRNMLSRCGNKNNPNYDSYGGRGIRVHYSWHDFENFYRDVGPPPSDEHTLDRVDNDKGYGPNNCRWATRYIQSRNTRANRYIEFNGKRNILRDWAMDCGLNYVTLHSRLGKLNWPMDKALTIAASYTNRVVA